MMKSCCGSSEPNSQKSLYNFSSNLLETLKLPCEESQASHLEDKRLCCKRGPCKKPATPIRMMMANLAYRVPDELPDASGHMSHPRQDQQKNSPAELRFLGQ